MGARIFADEARDAGDADLVIEKKICGIIEVFIVRKRMIWTGLKGT